MNFAKVLNRTGTETCPMCLDDGWVTLIGTVSVGSTTYERGVAPCKWCEWGQTVRQGSDKSLYPTRKIRVDESYQLEDVWVPNPPLNKADPKARRESVAAMHRFLAALDEFHVRESDRNAELAKTAVPQIVVHAHRYPEPTASGDGVVSSHEAS